MGFVGVAVHRCRLPRPPPQSSLSDFRLVLSVSDILVVQPNLRSKLTYRSAFDQTSDQYVIKPLFLNNWSE